MTEWKTIPIKVTIEEDEVLQRVANYYKLSRNKLIKNILGLYLQGELQNSVFGQLQLEKVIPKEFISEYTSINKTYEKFLIKIEKHFNDPKIQQILKQKWKETPKDTRDRLKKAGVAVRSLTRKRRRKVGRPKKTKEKPRRPKITK